MKTKLGKKAGYAWACTRSSAYIIVGVFYWCLIDDFVGLLTVGVGASLDSLACSWALFSYWSASSSLDMICLVLFYLIMLCSMDIPGRPAFWKEMKEESIWWRGEIRENGKNRRRVKWGQKTEVRMQQKKLF